MIDRHTGSKQSTSRGVCPRDSARRPCPRSLEVSPGKLLGGSGWQGNGAGQEHLTQSVPAKSCTNSALDKHLLPSWQGRPNTGSENVSQNPYERNGRCLQAQTLRYRPPLTAPTGRPGDPSSPMGCRQWAGAWGPGRGGTRRPQK